MIILLFIGTALNVYGGLLSYMSPVNKIIDSKGAILKNNSLKGEAYLIIAVDEDGIMEVHLYWNDDELVTTSIPLKFASVATKEISTGDCDDSEATAYIVKYNGFQITYADMNGHQSFIIDRSGRERIQFVGKETRFFNYSWDVIKKKNGSEIRNAGDVDSYFHGLFMDKRFGRFN